MKRVIALIILIIFPAALFAVFEWSSESATGAFTGGETSMKVTWDLTDLEIKAEHTYWFTQDGETTTTAVLSPGVDDGDFVGLGTVVNVINNAVKAEIADSTISNSASMSLFQL